MCVDSVQKFYDDDISLGLLRLVSSHASRLPVFAAFDVRMLFSEPETNILLS